MGDSDLGGLVLGVLLLCGIAVALLVRFQLSVMNRTKRLEDKHNNSDA